MAVNERGTVSGEVVDAWDTVADAYQHRYEIPSHGLHLGPMVPSPADLGLDIPLRGRRVLDFGCGGGQNAVACALAGASEVVAVDPSARQLDVARALAARHDAPVTFRVLDDATLEALPTDLDLVLSVYALHFVADAARVIQGLATRLRPGGTLLMSVDHPLRVAGTWQGEDFVVPDYFANGWHTWPFDFPEAGLQVEMRRFRRTVQDWVMAVLAAPLTLRGLYEPLPVDPPDTFGRRSKYGVDDPRNVFTSARLSRIPGSLVLVAERCP
jgi:SAM-dependent methyltransferase